MTGEGCVTFPMKGEKQPPRSPHVSRSPISVPAAISSGTWEPSVMCSKVPASSVGPEKLVPCPVLEC